MGKGKGGSSLANRNNQHANIHNPNSPAHKAARDNRSTQLNPNSSAYRSSRQGKSK